jgi:hypothetical protein
VKVFCGVPGKHLNPRVTRASSRRTRRLYTPGRIRSSREEGGTNIPQIEFSPGQDYLGEGISRGLARGILVSADGRNITGEGMGIGAVALKDRSFSYFSLNCNTVVHAPDLVEKIFFIDSRMIWRRGGSPSVSLTWCLERMSDVYMRSLGLQILLRSGSHTKRFLGLNPVFEPIPSMAEAQFTYRIAGSQIDVSCTIRPLSRRLPSVFILSELAADSFTHAFSQGKAMKPPSGWARHEPGNDLYDPVHRLRFTFSPQSLGRSVPSTVWWGREHTKNLRWAGYSIEFPECHRGMEPISCSYAVCLQDEPHDGRDKSV